MRSTTGLLVDASPNDPHISCETDTHNCLVRGSKPRGFPPAIPETRAYNPDRVRWPATKTLRPPATLSEKRSWSAEDRVLDPCNRSLLPKRSIQVGNQTLAEKAYSSGEANSPSDTIGTTGPFLDALVWSPTCPCTQAKPCNGACSRYETPHWWTAIEQRGCIEQRTEKDLELRLQRNLALQVCMPFIWRRAKRSDSPATVSLQASTCVSKQKVTSCRIARGPR